MSSKKFLAGGLVGGFAFFLLGWLVFGMMLNKFMMEHSVSSSSAFRGEANMVWWAMAVGNLSLGFLLSYVIAKAGCHSAGAGLITGAVTALLTSLATNCITYAQIDLWDSTALITDVAASTVVGGIVGAIIGWIQSKV